MRKEVQEMFDAGKVTKDCIDWIRDFFEQNGQDCNAVVGISGGKDSSVVAALMCGSTGKRACYRSLDAVWGTGGY